jgi:hypothetical protein
LTLNQVIHIIRTLAVAHKQINHFRLGEILEANVNGEVLYPACFCEILPGFIDRSTHTQRFGFRLNLLDLVKVSEDTEGNEQEALSDMHSVASDMVSMLMNSDYDWDVVQNSTVNPLTEYLDDLTAGCFVEVGIDVPFLADRCQVPQEDVEFEEPFDMPRTRILPYEGTGSEGTTFSPTDLAGKIVIAVYRAGSYKRSITTVPTDSDRIRIVGTDLGDRKGILSTTGAVQLSADSLLSPGEVVDFLIYE